jgi:hypothetical protein
MGESQSEVDTEYRVIGKKKRQNNDEEAARTGFGTGTIVDYQRQPSISQQSFTNVEENKDNGVIPARPTLGVFQQLKR